MKLGSEGRRMGHRRFAWKRPREGSRSCAARHGHCAVPSSMIASRGGIAPWLEARGYRTEGVRCT